MVLERQSIKARRNRVHVGKGPFLPLVRYLLRFFLGPLYPSKSYLSSAPFPPPTLPLLVIPVLAPLPYFHRPLLSLLFPTRFLIIISDHNQFLIIIFLRPFLLPLVPIHACAGLPHPLRSPLNPTQKIKSTPAFLPAHAHADPAVILQTI